LQETPGTQEVRADAVFGSQRHDLNSELIATVRDMALQFKLAGQRACIFRVDEQQILQTTPQEGTK
jgi:hypothetical protein